VFIQFLNSAEQSVDNSVTWKLQ